MKKGQDTFRGQPRLGGAATSGGGHLLPPRNLGPQLLGEEQGEGLASLGRRSL